MSSFAKKPDRFKEFKLSKEQFITSYEIAKIKYQSEKEIGKKVSDADVLEYMKIDKDPSIISKIKAGYAAHEVTKKLLVFINHYAPDELPQETRTIIESWK